MVCCAIQLVFAWSPSSPFASGKKERVCAAGSSREQIAEELANAAPLEQATLDMGRPVDAEKEAEPYKAAEAATGTLPSKDTKEPVKMEQD